MFFSHLYSVIIAIFGDLSYLSKGDRTFRHMESYRTYFPDHTGDKLLKTANVFVDKRFYSLATFGFSYLGYKYKSHTNGSISIYIRESIPKEAIKGLVIYYHCLSNGVSSIQAFNFMFSRLSSEEKDIFESYLKATVSKFGIFAYEASRILNRISVFYGETE